MEINPSKKSEPASCFCSAETAKEKTNLSGKSAALGQQREVFHLKIQCAIRQNAKKVYMMARYRAREPFLERVNFFLQEVAPNFGFWASKRLCFPEAELSDGP